MRIELGSPGHKIYTREQFLSAYAWVHAGETRGATGFVLWYAIGFIGVNAIQTILYCRGMVLLYIGKEAI